jgi:lipopolysaccharide transport system ATP-binding protein
MNPILEIQNVGKQYKIQHIHGGYLSLRERILQGFSSKKTTTEDFWALRDISFDVNAGDSIGIIGRNGAGKSTLLKVLSRITPPTRGKIIFRGRIASLLEVGTGFHQELTGRENIFFNGSLLGMKRVEIVSRFDEIVEFSGVEKFLDTALKHYSSGMQLRLAFAVAAFLEPEILIIDEVLAVGDAEFQKKCLSKMEDVTKSGRTILFVSHQLGSVRQLCQKAILLDKGSIINAGQVDAVINEYTRFNDVSNEFDSNTIDAKKNYQILTVKSLNGKKEKTISFAHSEEIVLEVSFVCHQDLRNTHLMISVNNKNVQRIFSSDKLISDNFFELGKMITVFLTIPGTTLTPGNYSFFVSIHCPNAASYDVKDQVCPITVYDSGSEFVQYENRWFYGDVFVNTKWEIKK